MKARGLVLASFDEPATLAEIDIPMLASDQVLLSVKASSVNAFDWKVADGKLRHAFDYDFPVTIGRDYAGVVEAVGDEVKRAQPGDAVFGYLGGQRLHRGAFAEFLSVAEDECFVGKPTELTFEQAACLPLCGVVAWRCVAAVDPGPGDVVAVVGAPGGVGSFAVQLAARLGAHVVASGPESDRGYLFSLGVSDVVEPGPGFAAAVRSLHPGGVSGLIDLVDYRPQFAGLLGLLRRGGRAASVHGSVDETDLEPLGLTGTNVRSNPDRALLEELGALAAKGELIVPIQQIYPLDDVVEALATARDGHTRGKSVVAP